MAQDPKLDDPKLDIPNELRNFAEKGVDQARSAIDGMFGAAHKALSDVEQRMDEAQQNARDIGRTTVDFAETNIAAAFDFAARLARAPSLEQWNRLHAEFVTEQAQRLSEQARTLSQASVAAAGKAAAKPSVAKASTAKASTVKPSPVKRSPGGRR